MRRHDPLVVEVVRGPCVESRHLVDLALADASGRIAVACGDVETPVFPRSSVKLLQALPLVESGAADGYGFAPRHLALACASHSREEIHLETVREMLARAGLAADDLECGIQPPAGAGTPDGALHNNCSGKHAGFLAVARWCGMATAGHTRPDHPLQRLVAQTLETATGFPHPVDGCGTDGCSAPNWPVPRSTLAICLARIAAGELPGGGTARHVATVRLRDACMAHPELVAGTGCLDTVAMSALNRERGRLFTKTGAEGNHVAALPEAGLGLALKCRDGAQRAAGVACAFVVQALLAATLSPPEARAIRALANPVLTSWRGARVGEIRVADAGACERLLAGAG